MIVTVFGASLTLPGQPLYQEALLLGKLLAESGYTVKSGGYIGTMEAVSRGAAEANGYVIGATCAEIETWRPVGANAWVKDEQKSPTLTTRLDTLLQNSGAFLALPGGVGTLAEILLAWNRMVIHSLPGCPLILIGAGWKETINVFTASQSNFISENDRDFVRFAENVSEAVCLLNSLIK
ncbi:MAG: LOG family protein [Anaerolineae bacterium]|nr:LOG family protein [Anaerolineae bacterium]